MTDIDAGQTDNHGLLKALTARHKSGIRHYRAVASELRLGDMNTRQWESAAQRAEVVTKARQVFAAATFEEGVCKKTGVLSPIKTVNETGEYLTVDDGETRYRAVRLLEGFDVLTGQPAELGKGVLEGVTIPLPTVPVDQIWFECQMLDKGLSKSQRRLGMLLANEGRPYTDLEYALHIKELLVEHVPQTEIAEALGKEPTWVSHIVKLNDAPAELINLLREGIVKTTTVIDAVEEFGADGAIRHILNEIEADKGQAAIDYQEAMEELHQAQAVVAKLLETGSGSRPAAPGSRITAIDAAGRAVQAASGKAEKAKRRMQHGASRVTLRKVRERAAASKKPDVDPQAPAPTGRVNRVNYMNLLDAVRHAARTGGAELREAMNAALKRCGLDPVVPEIEVPDSAATGTDDGVPLAAIVPDEQPQAALSA